MCWVLLQNPSVYYLKHLLYALLNCIQKSSQVLLQGCFWSPSCVGDGILTPELKTLTGQISPLHCLGCGDKS